MAKSKHAKETVRVNNPAYKGATPDMVGRALLLSMQKDKPKPSPDNKKGDPKAA